jgi:hypothetical protein
MGVEEFRESLLSHFDDFRQRLATDAGDWTVKGFIDVYRNLYTISVDTKVVSKIVELMLFPVILQFAATHGYKMVLSEEQNHYPDVTFILQDGRKVALDLKSTYRVNDNTVNGLTLGAFTGYFRQRTSKKNVTFAYGEYSAHLVLGIVYSRSQKHDDEKRVYSLDELPSIVSVVRDFEFLLQEKWRIAVDRPGSGNTKNMGSVNSLQDLINGTGPFSPFGEAVFDDYWMNYLTQDMARAIDSPVPYHNLKGYWQWKQRGE